MKMIHPIDYPDNHSNPNPASPARCHHPVSTASASATATASVAPCRCYRRGSSFSSFIGFLLTILFLVMHIQLSVLVQATVPLKIFQGMNAPMSIALDDAGNMYVADVINNNIVKFNAQGVQQPFTTSTPLSEPMDVAVGTSGNVYVADSRSGRIIRFDRNGAQLQEFTTSSPSLYLPYGVAVDASGNVYVADTGNSRVVIFNAAGGVTQVFNRTMLSIQIPRAITLDHHGNIYVSGDGPWYRVVKLNSTGVVQQTFIVEGLGYSTDFAGVAVDLIGNVYVADGENGVVYKFNATGVLLQTLKIAPPKTNSAVDLWGVAVDGNGNVYVTDVTSPRIIKYHATTHQQEVFMATTPTLAGPTGISLDPDGNMYVIDTHLIKLDASGRQVGFASDVPMPSHAGIAVDASQNIYVTDATNIVIRHMNAAGASQANITIPPTSAGVTGVAVDAANDLYIIITETAGSRVIRINSAGVVQRVFETSAPALVQPEGVAVDKSGNVYVADRENQRIVKFSSSGAVSQVFTTNNPPLYTGSERLVMLLPIVKFSSAGAVSRVFTSSEAPSLFRPHGVGVDAFGNVYTMCIGPFSNSVIKFNAAGVIQHEFFIDFAFDPESAGSQAMAVDATGNVYVVDNTNRRIVMFGATNATIPPPPTHPPPTTNPTTPTPTKSPSSSSSSSSFSSSFEVSIAIFIVMVSVLCL